MTRIPNRREIVAGLGAVVAAFTAGAGTARAQSAAGGFTPARHDTDRWMDGLRGQHRVFIDSSSRAGGADALLYANNLFATNQAAYGIAAADLAMIVCFRHASTPFGYSDAMWAKYGTHFSRVLELPQPATVNPVNAAQPGMPPGSALGALIDKGLQIAICANATRFIAGQAAAATGGSADAIFAELTANPVRNGRFVPAGVVAATRSQEYGYSLLSCG